MRGDQVMTQTKPTIETVPEKIEKIEVVPEINTTRVDNEKLENIEKRIKESEDKENFEDRIKKLED